MPDLRCNLMSLAVKLVEFSSKCRIACDISPITDLSWIFVSAICGKNAFNDRNDDYRCKCNDGYEGNPMDGCTGTVTCTYYRLGKLGLGFIKQSELSRIYKIYSIFSLSFELHGIHCVVDFYTYYIFIAWNLKLIVAEICLDNAHYDSFKDTCVCDDGYYKGRTGDCIRKYRHGKTLNRPSSIYIVDQKSS